jgi:hypothetical protein
MKATRLVPTTSPLSQTPAELTATIRTLAADLVASMAPHDAFDVVATLAFLHFVQDPDEYREAEQTPAAHIEYAVDLARKRGNRHGTTDGREPINGAILEDWNQKLGTAVALSLLVASKKRNRGANDAFEALRQSIASQDLFVRGRAYDHQERDLIKDLFGAPEVDTAIKAQLGFGARDALAVFEALTSFVTQRWNERDAKGRTIRDELLPEYASARQRGGQGDR